MLSQVSKAARGLLDDRLERLAAFQTERCCDCSLTPEESAMHREARAALRGLIGFYDKEERVAREELAKLKQEQR